MRSDLCLVRILLDHPDLKITVNKQGSLPSAVTSNIFVKAAIEKREMQDRGQDGVIASIITQPVEAEDNISSDSESEGEEMYELLNDSHPQRNQQRYYQNDINKGEHTMKAVRPTIIKPEEIGTVKITP